MHLILPCGPDERWHASVTLMVTAQQAPGFSLTAPAYTAGVQVEVNLRAEPAEHQQPAPLPDHPPISGTLFAAGSRTEWPWPALPGRPGTLSCALRASGDSRSALLILAGPAAAAAEQRLTRLAGPLTERAAQLHLPLPDLPAAPLPGHGSLPDTMRGAHLARQVLAARLGACAPELRDLITALQACGALRVSRSVHLRGEAPDGLSSPLLSHWALAAALRGPRGTPQGRAGTFWNSWPLTPPGEISFTLRRRCAL